MVDTSMRMRYLGSGGYIGILVTSGVRRLVIKHIAHIVDHPLGIERTSRQSDMTPSHLSTQAGRAPKDLASTVRRIVVMSCTASFAAVHRRAHYRYGSTDTTRGRPEQLGQTQACKASSPHPLL